MDILVHQPGAVESGIDNYEILSPAKFHKMYEKIYDEYINGTMEVSDESYLKGYVKVENAYQRAIDFLETLYAVYGFHIMMTGQETYYEFEDENTLQGVVAQWANGRPGLTLTQIRAVALWPNAEAFKNNTYWKQAVKFNEFRLFTSMTYPNKQSTFKELPLLEEIDCTNLTKMTNNFFWKCTNLWKVGADENNELPNLHEMGSYVFNYTGIEKISIPNLQQASIHCCFYQCEKLKTVHIDGERIIINNVDYTFRKLDSEVFRNCSALETVTGLSYVTEIGARAFQGCNNLRSVEHVSNTANIIIFRDNAFNGCQYLDFDLSNAEEIYSNAFESSGLTEANLQNIRILGSGSFSGARNLRTCTIREDWTGMTIPSSAFYNCSSLQSINLDNCRIIESAAFRNCSSLTTIGNTTNLIRIDGQENFYNCTSLNAIDLSNVKNIPSTCFYNCGVKTLGDTSLIERIGGSAFAYSGITGNISFPALEILGSQAFRGAASLVSLDIGKVSYIDTTDQAENWRECTSLQSFTSLYLTTIGRYDFYRCRSLTTLNLPAVTEAKSCAFEGCTSLTHVTNEMFPNLITTGDYCFYSTGMVSFAASCLEVVGGSFLKEVSSLESINIPSAVTIGDYAFYKCINLETVAPMPNVTSLGASVFDYCSLIEGELNFPNCTSVGGWCFSHCNEVTKITLGPGCTVIPNGVFYDCSSLTAIDTSHFESIGKQAFEGVNRVRTLDLSNLKYLTSDNDNDSGHFKNMTSLTTVTSLENLESIRGATAFSGCINLVTAPVSNKLKRIPWRMFENCGELVNIGDLSGCTLIEEFAFSYCGKLNYAGDLSSIEQLGRYAFRYSGIGPNVNLSRWNKIPLSNDHGYFNGCSKIVTVNISSLPEVPAQTFASCSNLESVTFSSTLTKIGSYAFRDCTKLNNIDLPATLESLDNQCFAYCTGLTTITIRATTPPRWINQYVFMNTGNIQVIYVPASAIEAYKTAQYWSNYAAIFQAIPS